jgi:predicted nucleic acid-binding Zn ribbon protein
MSENAMWIALPSGDAPGGARAPSTTNLVDSRCPMCGTLLKKKQRICSGKCRAALSRQRKTDAQASRDRQLRMHLKEALRLVDEERSP